MGGRGGYGRWADAGQGSMIGWHLGARLGGGGYVRLGDPSRLAGVAVVSSAVCGAADLVVRVVHIRAVGGIAGFVAQIFGQCLGFFFISGSRRWGC